MSKAVNHYQEWPLEECRLYFKRYFTLLKTKDIKTVRALIAEEFGRTISAIGLDRKSVV